MLKVKDGTKLPEPTVIAVAETVLPKNGKKKEEPKTPESVTLASIFAIIKQEKGEGVIIPATHVQPVRRLPTGNFEFDYYTGGGFPRGRYSIIYGPESSWKTGICLQAIASAQREKGPCNKAVLVNIEQSHDSKWAGKLGVDLGNFHIANPGYGEEAVDLVDALVRADDLNIMVIDSMAGLISSKEIAQSVEKADVMSSALLIKRMVNKLMIAFCEESRKPVPHYPTIILINQTRFKPTMFGDPETMPGGEAQKFLSSLRIRQYAKNIYNNEKTKEKLLYKDVNNLIKKAKVPVRASSFSYKVSVHEDTGLGIGETDSFNMVKGHLQSLGLLAKGPKDKGWVVSGITFPTLTEIQDQYNADWDFKMALHQMVLDSSPEDMIYVEESPATAEPELQSSATEG